MEKYFDTFVQVLGILGTISYAISGAGVGIRAGMDLFGVLILGITTAVGGGLLRDLLLGITPPQLFLDPSYAEIAAVTVVVFILLTLWRRPVWNGVVFQRILFWMDTLGLGVFAVLATDVAITHSEASGVFFPVFVGTIGTVGGGLLRDIFAGLKPYIFVKHIYACACVLGSLVYTLTWQPLGRVWSMLCGIGVVILTRFFAARFRWNLPHIDENGQLAFHHAEPAQARTDSREFHS